MLAGGEIPETFVGYTPLSSYAPIAWIAGANILFAGLPAVLLFQFFVLLPLGLLLIYAIAARIGGRLLAYWAAALPDRGPVPDDPAVRRPPRDVRGALAAPAGVRLTGSAISRR